MKPIAIPFSAEVHSTPFSCTQPLTGLGTDKGTFHPQDLRFFVHDVRVVHSDGSTVDVALADDHTWQHAGVALLDFEDGSGGCENGTVGTHTVLQGEVPEGNYVGLRFTVGVPFALNHADAAQASAPLNIGQMHWGWQAGYKFLRFEGATEGAADGGTGYRVHLGSTGCAGTIGHITGCARPNRIPVQLDGFHAGSSTVVLQLDALLDGVDLHAPPADATPGCMAAADDPDCAAPFAALGLDLQSGASRGAQRVFALR